MRRIAGPSVTLMATVNPSESWTMGNAGSNDMPALTNSSDPTKQAATKSKLPMVVPAQRIGSPEETVGVGLPIWTVRAMISFIIMTWQSENVRSYAPGEKIVNPYNLSAKTAG